MIARYGLSQPVCIPAPKSYQEPPPPPEAEAEEVPEEEEVGHGSKPDPTR